MNITQPYNSTSPSPQPIVCNLPLWKKITKRYTIVPFTKPTLHRSVILEALLSYSTLDIKSYSRATCNENSIYFSTVDNKVPHLGMSLVMFFVVFIACLGVWTYKGDNPLKLFPILFIFGSSVIMSQISWMSISCMRKGIHTRTDNLYLCLGTKIGLFFFRKEKFKKRFEFNRIKGTVSYYVDNEKAEEAPFRNFTCFTQQKNELFFLVNRTSCTFPIIKLHELSNVDNIGIEEYLRLWNSLQAYMDTASPLPDYPCLEPYRANCPVTVAFDEATGRVKNFWQSMSYEEVEEAFISVENTLANTYILGDPIP